MSNLTSAGEIPLSELNPEYFKLLTKESKELVKFLKPYYSKMQTQQHPIPTLLLNWFKDTSVNYQNLIHTMDITKYTITKKYLLFLEKKRKLFFNQNPVIKKNPKIPVVVIAMGKVTIDNRYIRLLKLLLKTTFSSC